MFDQILLNQNDSIQDFGSPAMQITDSAVRVQMDKCVVSSQHQLSQNATVSESCSQNGDYGNFMSGLYFLLLFFLLLSPGLTCKKKVTNTQRHAHTYVNKHACTNTIPQLQLGVEL